MNPRRPTVTPCASCEMNNPYPGWKTNPPRSRKTPRVHKHRPRVSPRRESRYHTGNHNIHKQNNKLGGEGIIQSIPQCFRCNTLGQLFGFWKEKSDAIPKGTWRLPYRCETQDTPRRAKIEDRWSGPAIENYRTKKACFVRPSRNFGRTPAANPFHYPKGAEEGYLLLLQKNTVYWRRKRHALLRKIEMPLGRDVQMVRVVVGLFLSSPTTATAV